MYKQAHQTSARYLRDQSEYEAVGLTPEYSGVHIAPYVAQSPVQIGLSLVEAQTLAVNETVLVIGEVKEIRLIDDMIADDGHLNLNKGEVVAVTGLGEYHLPASLGRLPYPKS